MDTLFNEEVPANGRWLNAFLAVTETGSLYEVRVASMPRFLRSDDNKEEFVTVEKLSMVGNDSKDPVRRHLARPDDRDSQSLLLITGEWGMMLVDPDKARDLNFDHHFPRPAWSTMGIVALFDLDHLTVAHGCYQSEDLHLWDCRYKGHTARVINAIGDNHPFFVVHPSVEETFEKAHAVKCKYTRRMLRDAKEAKPIRTLQEAQALAAGLEITVEMADEETFFGQMDPYIPVVGCRDLCQGATEQEAREKTRTEMAKLLQYMEPRNLQVTSPQE